MSEDFLASMAASSRRRAERARAALTEHELRARALAAPLPPALRLTGQFDLITEVKFRSPAAGLLQSVPEDLAGRVRGYAAAGAAAISVLTEPDRFDGSLDHLRRASAALAARVPAMRKDFLVDTYQLLEAREAGAGGVLLILRMLERETLRQLIEACAQLRLFALLEAFDAADLELAGMLVREYASAAQLLVGINCRDLTTLKVVPGRLESLAHLLPRGVPCVAESGVNDAQDAARLARSGYDVALVGSALMLSADPSALAESMLSAGREAALHRCG
jgi:indole-3-glycerol phosphate synthase